MEGWWFSLYNKLGHVLQRACVHWVCICSMCPLSQTILDAALKTRPPSLVWELLSCTWSQHDPNIVHVVAHRAAAGVLLSADLWLKRMDPTLTSQWSFPQCELMGKSRFGPLRITWLYNYTVWPLCQIGLKGEVSPEGFLPETVL